MIVQTSTKKEANKKTKTNLDSQAQFDALLKDAVGSRLYDYMESGKKITDQVKAQVIRKCTDMLNSEYRIKGSRLGHINHAPENIQKAYNEAKELISNLTWTTDSVEYTISLLAKKVTTTEVVGNGDGVSVSK